MRVVGMYMLIAAKSRLVSQNRQFGKPNKHGAKLVNAGFINGAEAANIETNFSICIYYWPNYFYKPNFNFTTVPWVWTFSNFSNCINFPLS